MAKRSKKEIEFRLQEKDGTLIMSIGYLPWPFGIKRIELVNGDIVIVHDTKGEAVFVLEDIHLSDLSHHDDSKLLDGGMKYHERSAL